MSDLVTGFYTKDGIKKYDYNALANLPEGVTDVTNTVISPNADYAEVGEWADGNPDKENRLGYFVTIANVGDNTIKIRKATSEDDIRGVSVYNPAFSGNASKAKYGEDGELLPQYNYIGVMGIVKVIDNGSCTVGGRCMSDDDGTAIPSDNNMGYAVLERVDETHVLIAVEPGADMIQRVKTDVKAIEDKIADGVGLTEEDAALLGKLSKWYDEKNYEPMTAKFYATPGTTNYEMGSSHVVTFSWKFSKLPVEVTFNGVAQTVAQEDSVTLTVASKNHTTLSYTLYGKYKDDETVKETINIDFRNNYYYGCAADPTEAGDGINSDFIRSLSGRGRANSKTISFLPNCSTGEYIWYAYPARFGAISYFKLGGFQGSFKTTPYEVPVTNGSGLTEKYYVYRSINSGLGNLYVEAY